MSFWYNAKRVKRVSVINPEKISEALGIPWEHPREENCYTGEVKVLSKLFLWPLRKRSDDPALMTLHYSVGNLGCLERIDLHIESGGYESTIAFEGVQKVEYVPQYHYVEFKRWRGEYPDKLKVWWRGQFDLYLS
jgi:hypothetical protein